MGREKDEIKVEMFERKTNFKKREKKERCGQERSVDRIATYEECIQEFNLNLFSATMQPDRPDEKLTIRVKEPCASQIKKYGRQ